MKKFFLIDVIEFQKMILNIIQNRDYEKYIDNTIYQDDKNFKMGFIQGMNWAAMNACQCELFYAEQKDNTNE